MRDPNTTGSRIGMIGMIGRKQMHWVYESLRTPGRGHHADDLHPIAAGMCEQSLESAEARVARREYPRGRTGLPVNHEHLDVLLHPSSSRITAPSCAGEARSPGRGVVGFDVGDLAQYCRLSCLGATMVLGTPLSSMCEQVRQGKRPSQYTNVLGVPEYLQTPYSQRLT